jgi:ZIP family zinc transporter
LLPHPFETWGLYKTVAGIAAGAVFSALLEERLKPGLLLGVGIALHNFPEGIALGAMLSQSPGWGAVMAALMAAHCFPEALAAVVPMRARGASFAGSLRAAAILSLPMGLGALVGGSLAGTDFVCMCLSFAAGVMLYITCGEIIPEANALPENGAPGATGASGSRLVPLASALGFAVGVVITA